LRSPEAAATIAVVPAEDGLRDESGYPLPWPAYTAQDFARQSAGRLPPPVAPTRPPPADMPPLPLMVLDALADDVETIYTMRNCGDMVANGLAVVGEVHVLNALRSLLTSRLVGVWREYLVVGERVVARPPAGEPGTTDDDLRRYWFEMTPAGRTTWEAAEKELDAYCDAHPLEPRAGDDATPP
jgi:hypothetical protein